MRLALIATILAIGLLGPSAASAGNMPINAFRAIPTVISETCWHYENRARFKARDEKADFDVILADGCAEALRDVYVRLDSTPYVQKRARLFLKRLSEMKNLIIDLNMERTFGSGYGPLSMPERADAPKGRHHIVTGHVVSKTGEYLIAHQLGVLEAYRSWANATGFRLAALR